MAQPAAVLRVLVTANTKGATTGLLRLNSTLAATDAKAKGTQGQMAMLAKTAGKAGLAGGLLALGVGAKKAFGEFREAQKVTNQTNAVLKSTGNQAKVTATEIANLAQKISLKAGIDDEAIQSGQNLLLTFTKIRNETGKGNDVFNQATQTITDMSVALGQDLKSSAIQVGKALQDPEKGITALRRVGVNFTQTQSDMIKGWVAHGQQLRAQKFILKELTTEFGGSAKAQADGADKLKVAWENMFEAIGKAIGPTIEKVMGALARFINQMQSGRGAGGRFAKRLAEVGEAMKDLWPIVRTGIELMGAWAGVTKSVAGVRIPGLIQVLLKLANPITRTIELIKLVSAAIRVLSRFFTSVASTGRRLAGTVGDALAPAFDKLKGVVNAALAPLRKAYNLLKDIAGIAGGVVGKIGDLGGSINPFGKGRPLEDFFGQFAPFAPFTGKLGSKGSSLDALKRVSLSMGLSGGTGPGQGYRPGDDGWHGQNRAFDSSGPAGQMMAFAQLMAKQYGSKLLELIYTPLGFSIKNGRKTAPYAQADHFDHVHVAMQKGGVVQGLYRGGEVAHFNKWAGPRSHLHMGSQRELNRWANNHPASALRFYGWYSKHLRSNHSGTPVETHPAQRGGPIGGSGTGDTVPAMLEPGEFVMNRKATARMGPLLEAINKDIPRFASGGMVRAATAGRNAGFKGNALQYLLAIGGAESGNYTDMTGDMSLGGSYGPWMIHHPSHPEYNTSRLQSDWTYAAGAAYKISSGGTNWNPWTMFRNGGYRPYMDDAARVMAAGGGGKAKGPGAVKRLANIIGKNGKNLTLKGKQATKSHTPYGGLGRGGILEAFITAQSDRLNMASALAALTEDTQDDIAVARDAVKTWTTWLGIAQLNNLPAGITTTATNLKSARDTLADLLTPGASETSNNDLERANLLQTLLSQANLRTAVSQAQYGALRYGGQFADGGVVPGAIGSPRVIVAHGGETVSPVGAGGVQVIVNGDIINTPRGKKPVEVRDIRGSNRAPLPGGGGGWR